MRDLLQARESIKIQARSVAVAQKRVDSTNLFLEAGRAQIRDVLEAQDALVQAQNALTSAVVNYRVAELSLQRDTGLLEVNAEGLWKEYQPLLARRENVR
jgi:outer membrane protein TolC